MKKLLPLLLITPLFAIDPQDFNAEAKKIDAAMAAKAQAPKGAQEIMMISPDKRAHDFVEAFKVLSIGQMREKITFFLTDKSKISNIMEIDVLPGGTMVSFKLNSTKGIKYKIVPIEQIESVGL